MYFTNNGNILYYSLIALTLFLLAGITDYLDGYVARRTNTETSMGALLDLLADKLLVCIVLVWLVFILQNALLIFPVLLIIFRELSVSSLRQHLVENIGKNPVEVTYIAKSKTTLQFISISCLILSPHLGILFNQITIILVWLAAFISLYSLFNYIKVYKDYLN
tara:strand:- start:10 stop:501 length:492 start_codon:yes stop_codon:yes gene_type:complete